MTDKHDYLDNVLIKLKRQYEKDEAVAALIKKLKEKDLEIGKLSAEIDYLNSELKNDKEQKEINRLGKIEARKDELYEIQLQTNRKQRKKIKELIHVRNDLIARNNNRISLPVEYEMLFDTDIVSGWYPMSDELVKRVVNDGTFDSGLESGLIKIRSQGNDS